MDDFSDTQTKNRNCTGLRFLFSAASLPSRTLEHLNVLIRKNELRKRSHGADSLTSDIPYCGLFLQGASAHEDAGTDSPEGTIDQTRASKSTSGRHAALKTLENAVLDVQSTGVIFFAVQNAR